MLLRWWRTSVGANRADRQRAGRQRSRPGGTRVSPGRYTPAVRAARAAGPCRCARKLSDVCV